MDHTEQPSYVCAAPSRQLRICAYLPHSWMALALIMMVALSGSTIAAQSNFTIVLLPDTQYYSETFPATFNAQTHWIAGNQSTHNIQLVLGLGDIVQTPGNTFEWQNADAAVRILDNAGIPYFMAIGNHDYDGLAPAKRKATVFNQYFGPARYAGKSWYRGQFPAGSNENFYGVVTLGGEQFVILVLEFIPRDAALAWAQSVLNANLDKKVIVVTHSFEYSDNTRVDLCDTNDLTNSGNNGDMVWNKLLSLYPNVIMVVNGHLTTGNGHGHRTDLGVNGNLVNQMLSDYQQYPNGGDGWLRILSFNPAANQVQVQTYSPTLNTFLTGAADQFTLFYRNPGSGAGTATIAGRTRIARIGSTQDCQAVAGVSLTTSGAGSSSSLTGGYSLSLSAPAAYTVTAAKSGWVSQAQSVHAWTGFPADLEFFMVPQRGYITGLVKNSSGAGVGGVNVQISGGIVHFNRTVKTNASGFYSSGYIPIGSYTVSAFLSGHATQQQSTTVLNNATTTLNFAGF